MHKQFRLILLFSITMGSTLYAHLPFNKVIIWGHKLHTHTHSYIHWGFYRAFSHLGYETYWLDNHDSLTNIDCSNALFITEHQVDQNMPLREDCFYILHNCYVYHYERHKPLYDKGRCISLQVYTHDCLNNNVTRIDDCMYYNLEQKIIYLPWATDLLPHEIDTIKKKVSSLQKENTIYFVGSVGGGTFRNDDKFSRFEAACQKDNIELQSIGGGKKRIDMEDNIKLIQKSYMAPALQGSWQCEKGYIPCRIFKNISYGQFGITNSQTVYDLFKGKIVYNSDPYQLFYDAKEKIENLNINDLYELMDLVRDKHTYLNRIETLLNFLEMVYNNHQERTAT